MRDSFDDVDESGLVLWQEGKGYRVSNIVPRNVGELGIDKYNVILRGFVAKIAEPAASTSSFGVELTSPYQSLDDWLDAEPAAALRRFSRSANKSPGAAHPMDRARRCYASTGSALKIFRYRSKAVTNPKKNHIRVAVVVGVDAVPG